MSDTPISDSTPHNVADLGMLCRRLERELNAANDRIKRLEDRIHRASMAYFRDGSDGQVASQMLQILEEERGKQ
jgi:hypothetical protein